MGSYLLRDAAALATGDCSDLGILKVMTTVHGNGSGLFGCAMVVGAGNGGLALHTLGLFRRIHPTAPIWLLDDATVDGTAERLERWAEQHPPATVYRSPRQRGKAGVAASIFWLYHAVCNDPVFRTCDILLQLDPDALLTSGSVEVAARTMFEKHGPGLVGAVRRHPSGIIRDVRRQRRNLVVDLLPIGPTKIGPKVRVGPPFWRPALQRARTHGYQLGTCVQGGAYVLHADTLRAVGASGFWSAMPDRYAAMSFEDDTLVPIGVVSVAHALHEFADCDLVWWVQYRTPVPLTAQRAVQEDYALIHPLKDTPRDWAIRDAVTAAA